MPQYDHPQHNYTGNVIAVVGSRTFSDYDLLSSFLDKMAPITAIVSGGASGADQLAERYAAERGIPTIIHYADWERYGKSAGMLRNSYIVRDATHVYAFWDGKSRGTKNTIDRCAMAGKSVTIVTF